MRGAPAQQFVRQDVADDRGDDHTALGFVERGLSQLRHRAEMLGVDIGQARRAAQGVPAIRRGPVHTGVGQGEAIDHM